MIFGSFFYFGRVGADFSLFTCVYECVLVCVTDMIKNVNNIKDNRDKNTIFAFYLDIQCELAEKIITIWKKA